MTDHVISSTYLDQQTARASAILTAAFVATSALRCSSFKTVTLNFKYTRGAGGGAFQFKVELATAANPTVWNQVDLVASGAVAAGSDTSSLIQRDAHTYTSTSANAETFAFQIELGRVWEYIRVSVKETGAPGTPGTLAIWLSLA